MSVLFVYTQQEDYQGPLGGALQFYYEFFFYEQDFSDKLLQILSPQRISLSYMSKECLHTALASTLTRSHLPVFQSLIQLHPDFLFFAFSFLVYSLLGFGSTRGGIFLK